MGKGLGVGIRHGAVEHVDVQEREQGVLGAAGPFVAVAQRVVRPGLQFFLLRIGVQDHLLDQVDRLIELIGFDRLTALPSDGRELLLLGGVASSSWVASTVSNSRIAS